MNTIARAQSQRGFTIVELLIVIIIVAILAAISIVAYNGIQDRAQISALQNDLTSAKKVFLLYKVDNDKYPATTTEINSITVKANKSVYDTTMNNFYYCYNKVTNEFAIGARTASSKTSFLITSNSGIEQVNSVDGGRVCQKVGLAGWNDANGWINNGYDLNTTKWQPWITG